MFAPGYTRHILRKFQNLTCNDLKKKVVQMGGGGHPRQGRLKGVCGEPAIAPRDLHGTHLDVQTDRFESSNGPAWNFQNVQMVVVFERFESCI